MDIKKLAGTLHPLERKVMPFIEDGIELKALVGQTGISEIEVMRALQWLENKAVLKIQTEAKTVVDLDANGRLYLEKGLPERRFLESISKAPLSLEEIGKSAGLDKNEVSICLGTLKKKAAIELARGKARITDAGLDLLKRGFLEEGFLRLDFPKDIETLDDAERFSLDSLKRRKKIIKTDVVKRKTIKLTGLGKRLKAEKIDAHAVEKLTPEMLKDGSWRKKVFRRYDVTINVPKVSGGKRHFVDQAAAYARKVWTDLGFREMEGPILNTSFWNFDALFTAQDHPVRELQDTFYIKKPAKGKLPKKELVGRVKKAHEEGIDDSFGWRYSWDPEEAKKNVLRTHTTILSAETLARIKESELPAKFFSVGKCFRNETIDWKHHFEFNQTDGIVVDPDANFRNLLGYLKEFFKKMGYPEARFRPAHFPYTEPSVEIDVFHPEKKEWVELGGSGMFRPEVVTPLFGKYIPVLAWGPGFDRMLMEYYGIDDLRMMYANDIKHLREVKAWMK